MTIFVQVEVGEQRLKQQAAQYQQELDALRKRQPTAPVQPAAIPMPASTVTVTLPASDHELALLRLQLAQGEEALQHAQDEIARLARKLQQANNPGDKDRELRLLMDQRDSLEDDLKRAQARQRQQQQQLDGLHGADHLANQRGEELRMLKDQLQRQQGLIDEVGYGGDTCFVTKQYQLIVRVGS
jgi:hypothetical protein